MKKNIHPERSKESQAYDNQLTFEILLPTYLRQAGKSGSELSGLNCLGTHYKGVPFLRKCFCLLDSSFRRNARKTRLLRRSLYVSFRGTRLFLAMTGP